MSEKPPNTGSPESQRPQPGTIDPRGTIASGILLAIGILVGGNILVPMLASVLGSLVPDVYLIYGVLMIPQAAFMVVVVMIYARGKTRTGHGLLLGLAAILAVILLLVAACFGLVGQL